MTSPIQAGNIYLPFADLMRLEKINEVTYRSIAQPFAPGGDHPRGNRRAYGGHVYAQAAWAASQTVANGFVLHNITGWFILGGIPNVPFVYKVHTIRDGGSYCTRIVNVTQSEGKGICFTCTCSFKRDEGSILDVQEKVDLWDKYSVVLKDKRPEDFEEVPGMDVPWYWQMRAETGFNDKFPGLQSHKAAMGPYNEHRHPLDRRQLIFYRTRGEMPDDPNLHACAHLYASDRNSLFIVANHLNVGDKYTQMGSLAHTVVFHTPIKDLLFDADGKGKFFTKEDWTTRAAGGRGMFHSRVFAPDGTHVATLMQEGMIRLGGKPNKAARPESAKL